MSKADIIQVVLLLISLLVLTGCDPIYPPSNLKVEPIGPLSPDDSADIIILYPYTGGSIVLGWKNQTAEILEGSRPRTQAG